jgi:hypothetical protein
LRELSRYIDGMAPGTEDFDPELYVSLVKLQGELSSRLGRLYRDREKIQSDVDTLERAITEALEVLAECGLLGTVLAGEV